MRTVRYPVTITFADTWDTTTEATVIRVTPSLNDIPPSSAISDHIRLAHLSHDATGNPLNRKASWCSGVTGLPTGANDYIDIQMR